MYLAVNRVPSTVPGLGGTEQCKKYVEYTNNAFASDKGTEWQSGYEDNIVAAVILELALVAVWKIGGFGFQDQHITAFRSMDFLFTGVCGFWVQKYASSTSEKLWGKI